MKLAFVCVENAGRSQMAAAYAEHEVEERGLQDVEVIMGGTESAGEIHPVVADVMLEDGVDVGGRTPREITPEDLVDADVVVTMGCSPEGVCPSAWTGDARDWGLDDPGDASREEARKTRSRFRRMRVAVTGRRRSTTPR